MASCAIGFGVWASAGPGTGPGDNPGGQRDAPQPAAKAEEKSTEKMHPDLERMQGDWLIGERFLKDSPRLRKEVIDAALAS